MFLGSPKRREDQQPGKNRNTSKIQGAEIRHGVPVYHLPPSFSKTRGLKKEWPKFHAAEFPVTLPTPTSMLLFAPWIWRSWWLSIFFRIFAVLDLASIFNPQGCSQEVIEDKLVLLRVSCARIAGMPRFRRDANRGLERVWGLEVIRSKIALLNPGPLYAIRSLHFALTERSYPSLKSCGSGCSGKRDNLMWHRSLESLTSIHGQTWFCSDFMDPSVADSCKLAEGSYLNASVYDFASCNDLFLVLVRLFRPQAQAQPDEAFEA